MKQEDISRIIEMAWEDRTPFDAIEATFGLNQNQVIIAIYRLEGQPNNNDEKVNMELNQG